MPGMQLTDQLRPGDQRVLTHYPAQYGISA